MDDDRKKGSGFTPVSVLLPGFLEKHHLEQPKRPKRRKRPVSHVLDNELLPTENLAYVHSILLQCFMPLRHRESNSDWWQTGNRNATLAIQAGRLINPARQNTFKKCQVPAGPKARILTAYIFDYAYRHKTKEIDLGFNLHQAMQKMNVKVSGQNARELTREVENVAAADIILGVWSPDGSAHQRSAKVADEFSFWIESDTAQKKFWTPTMVLSEKMYESIREGQHMAPIYWDAYIALQDNPRAMDIFAFLSYRLRMRFVRPVLLHASMLHQMFGRDIKRPQDFWPRFKTSLTQALEHYPTARVEILNDAIRLRSSPPLVPNRKIGRIITPDD